MREAVRSVIIARGRGFIPAQPPLPCDVCGDMCLHGYRRKDGSIAARCLEHGTRNRVRKERRGIWVTNVVTARYGFSIQDIRSHGPQVPSSFDKLREMAKYVCV